MCLSYITQINHPLDIEPRNSVLLFKVTERDLLLKTYINFLNHLRIQQEKKQRMSVYTPPTYSSLSYGTAISSFITSARRLIPSIITSSSEYEKFNRIEL
jgi:hypothetical protein